MFIKLDDDYSNVSGYLYNLSRECDKDIIKINESLDELDYNMNLILDKKNK